MVFAPGSAMAKIDTNSNLDVNPKSGVEVDATVAYDNATTTPNDWLVPDQLESPSPYPAPSPDVSINVEPPLPAPAFNSPTPGPNDNFVLDMCIHQDGCNGQSCDELATTSCSVLESRFSCDCSGCRCRLDREIESEMNNEPTPSPMDSIEKPQSYVSHARVHPLWHCGVVC